MANQSDSGLSSGNPYAYNPNPSDVQYTGPTAYVPPPTLGVASHPAQPSPDTQYAPPGPGLPSTSNGTQPPMFTTSGTSPTLGSVPGVSPQTTTKSAAAGAIPAAMASQSNVDWNAIFNPPWVGQQSQQWLDFMTGPQGVQFQNGLAQQQVDLQKRQVDLQQQNEDLQKQIQTAAYTGDWAGMQTLQGQLQNVQISLAQNQAQVNDTIAQSNLTGSYHGVPTLQAQEIINQMGLASADQALQARGQDVSMAQIQAQLAQSPLVAWYTARGLPPPTTALMTGPAAWTPTTQDWNWSERGGIAPTGWSSVQDQVPLPPGVSPAA